MTHPVVQFQILAKSPDETATFYGKLFGWKIDANNALGYRRIDTGSEQGIQGGIWPAPPHAPDFVQLFVGVSDVGAAVTQATTLGARVIIPVTSLPDGDQMAVLLDPQGLAFALTTLRSSG
jgi:predicted enzyme related to lactoylglutathione lyase